MDNAQERKAALTLPDRVRMLMQRAGDTRPSHLSKRTNLGNATAHGILSGARKSPDSDTLLRIANAYDVSVDWLLGREGDDLPSPRAATGLEAWPEDRVSRLKHAFSHPAALLANPELKDPKKLAAAVANRAKEEGLSPEEIVELVEWSLRDPTKE